MLKSKRFETPKQITYYEMDNAGQFTKLQTIKKATDEVCEIGASFKFEMSLPEYRL